MYKPHVSRRGRPLVLLFTTITALLIASSPMSVPALAAWHYNSKVNSLKHKQQYGYWQVRLIIVSYIRFALQYTHVNASRC